MSEPKRNMLDRIADRMEQQEGPGILSNDVRGIEIALMLEDVMDSMPSDIMSQCGSNDGYRDDLMESDYE